MITHHRETQEFFFAALCNKHKNRKKSKIKAFDQGTTNVGPTCLVHLTTHVDQAAMRSTHLWETQELSSTLEEK